MSSREDWYSNDERGAADFERARVRGDLAMDLRAEIEGEADDE